MKIFVSLLIKIQNKKKNKQIKITKIAIKLQINTNSKRIKNYIFKANVLSFENSGLNLVA